MSDFILLTDYPASIHAEILQAIIRNDETIVDIAEDAAIELMSGYLNSRYDVSAIFAQRGAARNPILLAFAKDIVLYDLYSAHAPQKISENRVKRFERAIKWLEDVQAQHINPVGLPPISVGDDGGSGSGSGNLATGIITASNQKRNNHY
jgi:phage gp36-like protein